MPLILCSDFIKSEWLPANTYVYAQELTYKVRCCKCTVPVCTIWQSNLPDLLSFAGQPGRFGQNLLHSLLVVCTYGRLLCMRHFRNLILRPSGYI
jgi:hypothetical protein